jgi:hypothetical protein
MPATATAISNVTLLSHSNHINPKALSGSTHNTWVSLSCHLQLKRYSNYVWNDNDGVFFLDWLFICFILHEWIVLVCVICWSIFCIAGLFLRDGNVLKLKRMSDLGGIWSSPWQRRQRMARCCWLLCFVYRSCRLLAISFTCVVCTATPLSIAFVLSFPSSCFAGVLLHDRTCLCPTPPKMIGGECEDMH